MKENGFSMLDYVEELVVEWAEWVSQGRWYGIGFPTCTLEYRLMHEGILVRASGPRTLPCNEQAEAIEAMVSEMSKQNPNMALALRLQYINSGSLRQKAKKLNMSHVHFKYLVDMAKQWLAGRLSADLKYFKNFKNNACIVKTKRV